MRRHHHKPLALLLTLLLAGLPVSASRATDAEDTRWRLCPLPPLLNSTQLQYLNTIPTGEIRGNADSLSAQSDQHLIMQGGVQLEQQGLRLLSDRAEYDRAGDRLSLQGQVSLRSEGLLIEGDQANYSPALQQGDFTDARFILADSHGFGSAQRISLINADQLELHQLRYSTCPPEREDWNLRASRLKLNQATNTGEAYHAILRFKGVPLFYSPYLNFPLAGRKSGLLPPSFGSSDNNGTDVSLPFYWNIAPNQDATITPRHLSKRGNMLDAEYRFLSASQAGEIQGAWLADDKLREEDRSELNLQHRARLAPRWRSELRYHRVSDEDYYQDDLGSPNQSRNESQLERRLDLRYTDTYWQFLARAQSHQTLTGNSPYQRMPQLQLRGNSLRRNNRLQYGLYSEVVRFRHDEDRITGDRLELKPSLYLPMGGTAWFLTPGLSWRHTEYRLQDQPDDSRQVRSLPLGSVDGGLFFDRPLTLAGQGYTQTLEPRLYYLHIPYREQDGLPLFDTGRSAFSFASLFRDNRFNGADRQGDARQLTLALSSRLLEDANGKERASIAIAQARYLADRRVTLHPDEPVATRHDSDIIAEVGLSPIDSLSLRLTEQWNPQSNQTEQLNAGLRFAPQAGQLIHAGYRYYRPEAQHQADMTVLWPLGRRWRMLAHHNRDLAAQQAMENILGLEYESCCWKLRLIGQARRSHADAELKNAIMLTLELKGMASLGQTLEQSVARGILDN